MKLELGATFDRYTIEALLGEGGMGEVYRAYDPRLRRHLALKVLRPPMGTDGSRGSTRGDRERLLQEARSAAALSHPNAVAIFDVGEVDDVPFIAMELIDGTSLRTLVRAPGVTWERKVRWMLDVARVLGAAHERGLVHRDVKPENVMVRDDGVAKVLDFGIAKRMRANERPSGSPPSAFVDSPRSALDASPNLSGPALPQVAPTITSNQATASGVIVGTPRYLAPEQLRGAPLDAKVDQFAWGVVAYELLTGEPPFTATGTGSQPTLTPRELEQRNILATLTATARAPSALCFGLPAAIDAVVLRALAKEPEARYPTMHALVEALEAAASLGSAGSVSTPTPVKTTKITGDPGPLPPILQLGTRTPHEAFSRPAPIAAGEETLHSPQLGTFLRASNPALSRTDGAVDSGTTHTPDDEPPSQQLTTKKTALRPTSPARVGWAIAAIGAGAIGAAVLSRSLSTTSSTLTTTAASASISSAPSASITPSRFLDRPLPTSDKPAALVAYRSGLEQLHGASYASARGSFEAAVAADPTLAAAYLRLAVLHSFLNDDDVEARRAFKLAGQHRDHFTPSDQRLFDALEPTFLRDPPDLAAGDRALTKAFEVEPGNAELAFYVGLVRYDRGDLKGASAAFEAALKIDDTFAQAAANLAGVHAYLGEFDEAERLVKSCLAMAAGATECLWVRVLMDEQAGRCDALVADVNDWILKDTDDAYGYTLKVRALASVGRPRETLLAALANKWAKGGAKSREHNEPRDRMNLDVMEGHFDSAATLGESILVAANAENSWVSHASPTLLLSEVMLESGRDADARALADRYVKEHEAWLPPHRVDDLAIAEDPFPSMLAILRRAGAITPAEQSKQRQAWIDAWNGKVGDAYARFVWIWGYAAAVATDDEAKEAVAALATAPPLPPFTPQMPADAVIGRTFLRAGDVDRAIPFLERGAHACLSFDETIAQLRAYADLGEARARKGETEKACAAYRVVVDRWANATPRSVTLEAARRALATLKCAAR